MDHVKPHSMPAPPSLIKSLKAGFDAISNHIALAIFPILLDILLWLGPQLHVMGALTPILKQVSSSGNEQNLMFEFLNSGLERVNLFSILRTFPIGVPSLMVDNAPLQNPIGSAMIWEASSLAAVFLTWLAFTLGGLAVGTIFFSLIAQISLSDQINPKLILNKWPWHFLQVTLLSLAWLVLLLIVSIPFSCIFTILLLSGVGIGQVSLIAMVLMGGLLIWMLIPLAFSPHGIFVYDQNAWLSIRRSLRLTRLTFWITGFFLIAVILLSAGLDMLWRIPEPSSWLTLIGIAGHAFVATSLIASSFFYYRDANRWVDYLIQPRDEQIT